jgi:hypothetical protein
MTDITMTDLELENVELLPKRAALQVGIWAPHWGSHIGWNVSGIYAVNQSNAQNFGSWGSVAASAADQSIGVVQG